MVMECEPIALNGRDAHRQYMRMWRIRTAPVATIATGRLQACQFSVEWATLRCEAGGGLVNPPPLKAYLGGTCFATKVMTSVVYKASDSISTRPRMRAKRMAAVAPGIARHGFGGRGNSLALTQPAEAGSDTHSEIGERQV